MGKRSNFERHERDLYTTPYQAVIPLLPFLTKGTKFIEPCAADGRLIGHLKQNGHECVYACDIEPLAPEIHKRDLLFFDNEPWPEADMFITNPPWDRDYLHPMIHKMSSMLPTWLLFDAGWMHTTQAAPYLPYCSMIVSVGRVKWIADSKGQGMEDSCWYKFMPEKTQTIFIGRN